MERVQLQLQLLAVTGGKYHGMEIRLMRDRPRKILRTLLYVIIPWHVEIYALSYRLLCISKKFTQPPQLKTNEQCFKSSVKVVGYVFDCSIVVAAAILKL